MKRLIALLAFAISGFGATTTISDTLTSSVGGGAWSGRVVVSLNAPGSSQPLYAGTTSLAGWTATYCLNVTGSDCTVTTAAGVVTITIWPNDQITPAGTSYTARYTPSQGHGSAYSETWIIATGATTLRAIRSTTVPTPSVLFQESQLRLSPGAIPYGASTGLGTELAPGTQNYVLTMGAAYPQWSAVAACATCVLTSGSYADPAWITSLAGSKITGNMVSTITGTANQIAVSAATGPVVLSIPTNPVLPGTTTGTFNGQISRSLSGGGNTTILSTTSTLYPTTDTYQINITEGDFLVPFTYPDKVMQIGYNWGGSSRLNTSNAAIFMQFESWYQLNNSPLSSMKVTEWHLNAVDQTGTIKRPIGVVSAWDGGFSDTLLNQRILTFSDWSGVTKATFNYTAAPGAISLYSPTLITGDASPLIVKNAAETATYLAVDPGGSSLNTTFGVTAATQNILSVVRSTAAGSASLRVMADAGTKIGEFQVDGSGALVIRQSHGTAMYVDHQNEVNFRNASFANVMKLEAPVLRLPSSYSLAWSSTTSAGAASDSNISRLGAASLAVGNGTAGNTSGTLTAATFIGALTGNATTATALSATVPTGRLWIGQGTGAPTSDAGLTYSSNTLTITNANARINLTSSTGTNPVLLQFINTGGTVYQGADDSAGSFGAGAYAALFGTGASAKTALLTLGLPRLTVMSNGNVAIGTTTDDGTNKLQVAGSTKFSGAQVEIAKSTAFVGDGMNVTGTNPGYVLGSTVALYNASGNLNFRIGTLPGTNNGTNYATLFSTGNFVVASSPTDLGYGLHAGKTGTNGTSLTMDTVLTTGNTKELIVAGQGQSTNLTEWRAYNATPGSGTLLAAVGSTGLITGAGVFSSSDITIANGSQLRFDTRGKLYAPSDGVFVMWDHAQTSFNRLQGGGTTNAFPSWKRSSAIWQARLADDSADTDVQVSALIVEKAAPSASSDACTAKQIWAGDMGGTKYVFYCVSSGTIVRAAFASF